MYNMVSIMIPEPRYHQEQNILEKCCTYRGNILTYALEPACGK